MKIGGFGMGIGDWVLEFRQTPPSQITNPQKTSTLLSLI